MKLDDETIKRLVQEVFAEKGFQNTAEFRRGGYLSISSRFMELHQRVMVMAEIHPDPLVKAELVKVRDDLFELSERFGKLILESDDMKGLVQ